MSVQLVCCRVSAEERQELSQEPVRARWAHCRGSCQGQQPGPATILGPEQVPQPVTRREQHREQRRAQRPVPVQTAPGLLQVLEPLGQRLEQLQELARAEKEPDQVPEQRRGTVRIAGTGCMQDKPPERGSTGRWRQVPQGQQLPPMEEEPSGTPGAQHPLAEGPECSCRECPSLGTCGSSKRRHMSSVRRPAEP